MTTIERMGEGLARRIDRRRFLRRSAAAIFGAAAVWAAQGIRVPGASAQAGVCYDYKRDQCYCNPLGGWYCNQRIAMAPSAVAAAATTIPSGIRHAGARRRATTVVTAATTNAATATVSTPPGIRRHVPAGASSERINTARRR